MKIKLLVQILLSSFILSTLAAVPSEINYQGLITDTDGDPIESATNSVAVNLYQVETGGTAVYAESFTQVASDANGIYSIQIGGASLQSVLETNNELWLELIINEETLSPRQEINSVPYALVAKAAESFAPGSAASTAITTLQTNVDQNESDADAAIAALQAVDASSARQFVVDFGFTENKPNLNNISLGYEELHNNTGYGFYSCEVGDAVLLTGQSDSSENGIYEITSALGYDWSKTISLARSSDYDSAEEFNEGDLVLIERGGANGLAFMLGAISEAFVLGNDALTWYRCGINTNQDIEFTGDVTVGELRTTSNSPYDTELRLGESDNYFDLHLGYFEFRGSGGTVDFRNNISVDFQNYGGVDFDTDVEFNSTVTVQTPTQDNEVANKAYVDSVVIPPGGLIAWPSANVIPDGWSNAMLSSPMPNYIWIRKN